MPSSAKVVGKVASTMQSWNIFHRVSAALLLRCCTDMHAAALLLFTGAKGSMQLADAECSGVWGVLTGTLQKYMMLNAEHAPWNLKLNLLLDVAISMRAVNRHCDVPIIHGDLKSLNILVKMVDGRLRAKV